MTPSPPGSPQDFFDIGDVPALRRKIYDGVLSSARAIKPLANDRYSLALEDVDWADGDDLDDDPAAATNAKLKRKTFERRMRGTWRLRDAGGGLVSEKTQTIGAVPRLTRYGTFIVNGNSVALRHQQRLRAGAYARRKQNGEIESHLNFLPGEGLSHKYALDPERQLFFAEFQQSQIPLYSALKAMGTPDEAIKQAWGGEIFEANRTRHKYVDDVKRLGKQILPHAQQKLDFPELQKAVGERLRGMKLDPETTASTLGRPFTQLDPEAILESTKRLLAISRGESDGDSRDALPYQKIVFPDQLFAERLSRDYAGAQKQLLRKATYKGNLNFVPSSALRDQLYSAINASGLGQCYDAETYVLTRRGFITWPDVTDDDEFACRVDGRLEFHRATRIVRDRYVGPMIRCRTKRFSYLVTPNHRCYFRQRHRNGRKPPQYQTAEASQLVGRQRWHLTTLGCEVEGAEPTVHTLRWIENRHGRRLSLDVDLDLWLQYLGWWLAEGSAFVDGSQYKSVVAQSLEAHPQECDEIEDLLNRLPFHWTLKSRGKDYTICHKGLYEELASLGGCAEKRIPRYVFSLSQRRLRLLFDAYMLGDGGEYDGYLKAETASYGLALDLVELWGRLGGTAQIAPHVKPEGIYYFVSFSLAQERCVDSAGAVSRRGDEPIDAAIPYDGMVYCATVPGGLLYVLRDGKPHWSHNSLEETNPLEVLDRRYSITRMGEGGLPSIDTIPDDARQVHPSHLGFLDAWRTPESLRVGVDLYLSSSARRGPGDKLYSQFEDPRTGDRIYRSAEDVAKLTITTKNAIRDGRREGWKRIPAIVKGKEGYAEPSKVDLVIPAFSQALSPVGNLIPMLSAAKGQRLAMASRMLTQALPLRNAQAPLVQAAIPGTDEQDSWERRLGKDTGAIFADQDSRVERVANGQIFLRTADGKRKSVSYAPFYPYNRKTGLVQTPVVQPGQEIRAGQPLVRSNFTDESGAVAVGRNAYVGYGPWGGYNFEDAAIVSESYADQMASVQTYQETLPKDRRIRRGLATYAGLYPKRFSREQLSTLDKDGVVKPGTKLRHGDPLIVAVRDQERAHNRVHKQKQTTTSDAAISWEHEDEGTVLDVVEGRDGPLVIVESQSSLKMGDKISGRYGDKSVIAQIVPDAKMPRDKSGRVFDIMVADDGTISRANPAQVLEARLGLLAEKLGRPIAVEDFRDDREDLNDYVDRLASQHGIPAMLDVYDPVTNRTNKIDGGLRFFMKLSHMAEGKLQARGSGGYTLDGAPAGQGEEKSKRVGLLDSNALLAHGATGTLRSVGAVRGQQSPEYWLRYMQGYDPPEPRIPHVYEKAIAYMNAAGVNVRREGPRQQLMAMDDAEVERRAGDRFLKTADGVEWESGLREIPGGLFDRALTGGHGGKLWSKIKLAEPLPNPAWEEPIRHMLGLTQAKFMDVLAGREKLLDGSTGASGMRAALSKIDVDKELERLSRDFKVAPKTRRDAIRRKMAYLSGAKATGVHPQSWFLGSVPVLPPIFRPVTKMPNGTPLVSSPNYLYQELFAADKNLRKMREAVGDEGVGDERLAAYHAFKSVAGLTDPLNQKLANKNVKGVLADLFGSSPKRSMIQRKLISTTIDDVGRGVIVPNPDLDMDSIGIPEEAAYTIYHRHLVRRMRRSGVPLMQAMQEVKNRSPRAKRALLDEMDRRYVTASRAPVLHKFGYLSFKPRLVPGNALQISPLIVKGFGADFDGDAMNFAAPATDDEMEEARTTLLPSSSLLSPDDFKSPVHKPGQQYVGGLYRMSLPPDQNRRVRQFASKKAMLEAYERGELDLTEPVDFPEDAS